MIASNLNHSYGFDDFGGKFVQYNTKGLGNCDVCGNSKKKGKSGCVTPNNGKLVICKHLQTDTKVDGYRFVKQCKGLYWGVWIEDNRREFTEAERREWGLKKLAQERASAKEREKLRLMRLTQSEPIQINREYESAYDRHKISNSHRSEFERRGLSDVDIDRIRAYTIGTKLYIPIRDLDGLKIGAQFKYIDDPDPENVGYRWDRAANNKTKQHDELPVTFWGNRTNPNRIIFVEGIGFKAYIASLLNPNDLIIGAVGGQFDSSPKQICEALAKYPSAKLVLMPDGGAVKNHTISIQYDRLFELCAGLGREISVGWWEQFIKRDGDIDEIDIASTEIEYIKVDRYRTIAAENCDYEKVSKTVKIRGSESRDESYLTRIPAPKHGTITLISSAVGTGKTQQLASLLDRWHKIYPEARSLLLGYRNALQDQQSQRLDITSYKTGYEEDAALSNFDKLAIVVDSILRLDVTSIPAHSLIILDEVEAVLKHCALAETFGARASQIQERLIQILDRVLVSGGAIVALEDTITSITAKGLGDLTGNKYEIKLIENTHQRFKWDVSIGFNEWDSFIELAIARLQNNERIVVPTTSQKLAESLEREVVKILPHLTGQIQRIDSKTLLDKRELLADPVEFLRKNKTHLLIFTPTAESGFSIDDGGVEPLFDRVMAFFPNLDTRTHLQMLARYRSNCPRDIFVPKRGAECSGEIGRNTGKLLKKYRDLANTTALEQGYGKIENNERGEVWNRLEVEFRVRDAISSRYLYQFLRSELTERGHNVKQVKWDIELARFSAETGIYISEDIAVDIKQIKTDLDLELADALVAAKDRAAAMPDSLADIILSSSITTYEQKIVARRAKLNRRLPEIDLNKELIYDCAVKDRGRYLGQIELSYLLDKPALAEAIDKQIFARQVDAAASSHIIYSRVPRNLQKVKLFLPIVNHILDLATGREYRDGDDAVMAIASYARSKSYDFWMLFGLNMRDAQKDGEGKNCNTDISIVNKILIKLGWSGKRTRQLGTGKKRISIYSIKNAKCPHREAIYRALAVRWQDTIEDAAKLEIVKHAIFKGNKPTLKMACLDNFESLKPLPQLENEMKLTETGDNLQDLADGLRYIVRYCDGCALDALRDKHHDDKESMRAASKLLSESEQKILANMVRMANDCRDLRETAKSA